MKRVLMVGLTPESVDYSDPAVPPGLSAEKIHAGLAIARQQMRDRGWDAEHFFVPGDETGPAALERELAKAAYDCVVIGGGIRLPPRNLLLFEALVNAIRRAAPGAAIAFNSQPLDSAEAAARWLDASA